MIALDIIQLYQIEKRKVKTEMNQNRISICKLIAQALMVNRTDITVKDTIGISYKMIDNKSEVAKLFGANMIIRFEEDKIQIEYENKLRKIEKIVYKRNDSSDSKNVKLTQRIFEDFADFDSDYITTLQSIVITYFAH